MSWNPISDAENHIAAQERALEKYPTCDICGEVITEGYVLTNGMQVCDNCCSFETFIPIEEESDEF